MDMIGTRDRKVKYFFDYSNSILNTRSLNMECENRKLNYIY